MPLTHVECCDELHTLDELRAHVEGRSNRCHWTYELVQFVLAANTSHPSHEDPSRISTTVLTSKCLRRLVYERQSDYSDKLDNLWAAARGTQFHGQLEPHASPASYAEARFYVDDLATLIPEARAALPDSDRSLSGSPDLVDVAAGIQYDYKRTKEVPRFDRVWPDHSAQLNINRWLIERADRVRIREPQRDRFVGVVDGELVLAEPGEHDGLLLTELVGDDVYCTWDLHNESVRARFVPRFWSELVIVYVDDKGPKPIGATKSIRVPAKSGGTKPMRVPDIWDDVEVERYVLREYVAARRALEAGRASIPSGWEAQSHPLCVSCAFRRKCATDERQGR